MKKIYFGKVKFGRFRPNNVDDFKEGLKSLEGKEVQFSIGTIRKNRSMPQNRYYWGVVIPILSREIGYNREETHQALRIKFLSKKDGTIPTALSTTELSTTGWEDYMRDIRMWASSFLQCYIPQPNEVEM